MRDEYICLCHCNITLVYHMGILYISLVIEYLKGRKHPKDKVVLVNGHKVTFREWIEVFLQLCKNEDNIYPRPKYLGRYKLIHFLHECLRADKVTNEILNKYDLR